MFRRSSARAYDVTHAHNPAGEWTKQHLMAVNGKFAGIEHRDLMIVADRFGIGTADNVLKQVREAVANWPDFAERSGTSPLEIARIREHQSIL